VEACEDSEVPEPWRREAASAFTNADHPTNSKPGNEALPSAAAASATASGSCSDPISPVDRSVDAEVSEQLATVRLPSA
jgi:hypothetical protein